MSDSQGLLSSLLISLQSEIDNFTTIFTVMNSLDSDYISVAIREECYDLAQLLYDVGVKFKCSRMHLSLYIDVHHGELYDKVRNLNGIIRDGNGFSLLYHMRKIGRHDIASLLELNNYKEKYSPLLFKDNYKVSLDNLDHMTKDEANSYIQYLNKVESYNNEIIIYRLYSYLEKGRLYSKEMSNDIIAIYLLRNLICDDCLSIVKTYLPRIKC